MLRNKYAENKLMKLLRASKKRLKVTRKETSVNSRDIIISIFSQETQAEKLEYTKSKWRPKQDDKSSALLDNSPKKVSQPLKYLLPFLKLISKGVDIDICGFLFVDGANLHTVYNEKHIKIVTNRYNPAKVKYWLSHLYFSRLRNKLGQHLLEDGKSTAREIVHSFQEKEFMPSVIRGASKQSCPLVRKLKVSPDNRYRRHSEQQKQPFCIFFTKSGTNQQLSFSEALSFLDYTFNVNEIIYVKILANAEKGSSLLVTNYSKLAEQSADSSILKKYRNIYFRTSGWELMDNEMEATKMELLRNRQYEDYSRFVLLQLVSFIQVRHFLIVKSLELEWVIDSVRGVTLSNVVRFDTLEAKVSNTFDGLATLYQKILGDQTPRAPSLNFGIQNSARNKRVKSQQKQKSSITNFRLLPLQTAERDKPFGESRLDCPSRELFKNKGKSCVLRGVALFN